MSGPFGSSQWMYASGGFYNGVATQSLRFDDGSSAYLSRTPSSAGNRRTWTWSGWVKRSLLGSQQKIMSSASASLNYTSFEFTSSDTLQLFSYFSSATQAHLQTSAVFRDISAWYHIVVYFDAVNTTAKLYVNGIEQSLQTNTQPSNQDYFINSTNEHRIGRAEISGTNYFDGYLAEVNFVDGQALDPTYFGETKNGVWIAKEYTGSYGTNGFRLQFNQTGTGTPSSSTIGADTSGNANHFSSSGIVASDCDMPDSPENNMCTFNSVGRRYGQSYVATFSEGNLKAVGGGNATNVFGSMAINQIASQGGVYFEIRMDSLDTARTYFGVVGDTGTDNKCAASNAGGYSFPIKGMINDDPRGFFTTATNGSSIDLTANTAFSNGDVAGIAILSDGKFFCHRNGTYLQNASGNVGNPSTGANPIATIDLTLGDWVAYVGYNSSFSINFGQDGSFSGNETSGGYQDANGIGDFMFAVPTNCLAICSSNMAEPTISPSQTTQADDYFNTVTYTGTGSSGQAITGVNFQPDWLWIKKRSGASSHNVFDSVRGVAKRLITNGTSAEDEPNQITSFDTDGFTINSGNDSGATYVAWNWKAGGTAVSNTDGSITSSLSANTDAGFSIVTYTGNETNSTVGHGLGKTPSIVIVKNRDEGTGFNWNTWFTGFSASEFVQLSTTSAKITSSGFWNTTPTSTVFGLSTSTGNNKSGDAHIAYCFAEIEGYSKFGSYIGNGSTDGTFVYTGFRPAFVILRRSDGTSDWFIWDDKRNENNPTNRYQQANLSDAEGSGIGDGVDFLSNGFKVRSSHIYVNVSGASHIYMAFAENPFKYANAR